MDKQKKNSRKNKKKYAEDKAFDFKSLKQHTEQLNPSNHNPQEDWKIVSNTKYKQNPQNQNSNCSTNNNKNPGESYPLEWHREKYDKQTSLSNKTKNEPQKEIKTRFFGFKHLEELCNKEPSEIIFVISNTKNGFMDLFKQNKAPDWLLLLIKVSAKICCAEFNQHKHILLTELASNTFLDHLKQYILNTPTEKMDRCAKLNEFFDDCLVVFQSITNLFPKTAVEKLKEIVVVCNIALNGIKLYSDIEINETTLKDMSELLQKLNDIKITNEVKIKEKLVYDNIAQNFPPPQNFRELTVFPTVADLEDKKPFLRPNIIKGSYNNIEHYLDVQFRLLREDFIAPLREGIHLYKEMTINKQQNQVRKKINNIHIYRNVVFEIKSKFIKDKYAYVINFNNNNKLKINWEVAKRFMFGSLLLFTENDFRTFFLGVVLEREIKLLRQGKLNVHLIDNAKPVYSTSLIMVESKVYFEPYKCSMEVLKNMTSNNFPMKKYLISACTEIDYPRYINGIPNQQYSIDNVRQIRVLFNNTWPTKELLKLDEMQYNAFRAALTNELTIIQGPPGTGKTFIGLKIMETLINNLYVDEYLTKPILVVCYTNHALDQFMEGILNYTTQVVRIGGQSKSKILANYNLNNIRYCKKTATTIKGLKEMDTQLSNAKNKIEYLSKCREEISYNGGVLELSLLKNGMPTIYHSFFKTNLDLLSWLFWDYNYFDVDPIQLIQFKFNLIDTTYVQIKPINLFSLKTYFNNIYIITLNKIVHAFLQSSSEIHELEKQSDLNVSRFDQIEILNFEFKIMQKIHEYFANMLSLADDHVDLPQSINLSTLNMKQRWALYFKWVRLISTIFQKKQIDYEQEYACIYNQYKELKELENIEILKTMHVIAITTTGAAKHRVMLEGLQSPIVVVEEAAEVLEAHIVSSLTKHCQHLILVGDHKQLRPSNAVYKLAKDYNFDISLFERMVNNDVPCYTLGEQHRMRPEISKLLTPSIYTDLKNHSSVFNRENVRGVTKNLFFLHHNNYETEIDEISSKSNEHEAKFLIMFARHLILQGYKTEQVTILTTYSGQLFLLRSLKQKHSILEDMKIIVVDNYQGEESDIILLSLVRSNEMGNVGFLNIENRVCVALSRAKYGLYIMGNMDNLNNSSDLWKQIKESLVSQDSYGDELTLECVVHSGITTKVSKSEDFNIITEGGCNMLCETLLLCGHYCKSLCHPYDREHVEIKCREPCNRSCNHNHPCMKICFEDCEQCNVFILKDLPCGHQSELQCFVDINTFDCDKMVETVLDKCGHRVIHKCFDKNPDCTFKCFDRLDCGHACVKNCHKNDDPNHENYKCIKPCENMNEKCTLDHKCLKLCYEDCSYCTVKIDRTLPCGHIKKSTCGLNVEKIKCLRLCDRILMCNHKCKDLCYQPCPPCRIQVEKIIPYCGHTATIECASIPTHKDCTQICDRTLKCGHKCKRLCTEGCTSAKCVELVLQKTSTLACGHNKVWVLCCDRNKEFSMDSEYLLDKCREPCLKLLNCKDICRGTCGKCKQGRLHVPCSEICNKINPCNHVCKYPCKEKCPPCNDECLYSCVHSKCKEICSKPCVTCKEKCNYKCKHLSCTKLCEDICDRPPCYEPCDLKLECGHDCIGFCGEPCPPLCRICQNDEVTTILFGKEDEPDARFVYLEDCGHSIESRALEQWMNQNNTEITMKQCPLCKTLILKTQRFMNIVKLLLKDIAKIKIQQCTKLLMISFNKSVVLKSIISLNDRFDSTFIGKLEKRIKNLWTELCRQYIDFSNNHEKKKICLSANEIESLDFVVNLFESILKYNESITDAINKPLKQTIINHFVWLLSEAFIYGKNLSNQQKFDINMEMVRGARIMSLYKIVSSEQYQLIVKLNLMTEISATEIKKLITHMEAILMSCQIYNFNKDKEIQKCMELIKEKIAGIEFISDEEKKMIHKAMSVSFYGGEKAQGHWCKCPNNHIYCITECGGPMQESVCPECKVKIGGRQHRYVSGVTVASEMDGARGLAWSSANDMANYLI